MAVLGALYHVGIVVPDIDAAQARFTELLGITWGPVISTEALPIRDEHGRDLVVPNSFCYSVEEPRLELVLELPGSVWECNEHSNLHHIGVWSDALPADSARYGELRCPLEICGRSPDVSGAAGGSPQQFAYHRDALGVRIELVDVAIKPLIEQFMAGGSVA